MGKLRELFTETLPSAFAAWLLAAYRRPLTFLLSLVVLPLVIIFFITHNINDT